MEPENNIVYIGKKPTMAYVMAMTTQAAAGHLEIFIKARGRAISKAVDVLEVSKNMYLKDYKVESIETATEQRTSKDERTGADVSTNVSTISIKLVKG